MTQMMDVGVREAVTDASWNAASTRRYVVICREFLSQRIH